MPFAFSTSALFLPDLCSILRPKCEAQDRAMLHAAIINFRRRIVNRTRGFSCRAAAQFNPGIEVLRWGYGGVWVRLRRYQHAAGGQRTRPRLQKPFGTRGGIGFDFLRNRRSLLGLTSMLYGGRGSPHPAASAAWRTKLRRLQFGSRFRGCHRKSMGHPLFHLPHLLVRREAVKSPLR